MSNSKPIQSLIAPVVTSGSTTFTAVPAHNFSGSNILVTSSFDKTKHNISVNRFNHNQVTSSVGSNIFKTNLFGQNSKTGTIATTQTASIIIPLSASSITEIDAEAFVKDSDASTLYNKKLKGIVQTKPQEYAEPTARFDLNNNILNTGTTNITMSAYDAEQYVTGITFDIQALNASDDNYYLKADSYNADVAVTESMTCMFLYKADTDNFTTNIRQLVYHAEEDNGQGAWCCGVRTFTTSRMLFTNGTKIFQYNAGPDETLFNDWHHLTYKRTGTNNIKLYLDGTEVENKAMLGSPTDDMAWRLHIGNSGSTFPSNGYLNDVRFYDFELDDATIYDIAQSALVGVLDGGLGTYQSSSLLLTTSSYENYPSVSMSLDMETSGTNVLVNLRSNTGSYDYAMITEDDSLGLIRQVATSPFEQYGAVAHWDARFKTVVTGGTDNSVSGGLYAWTDLINDYEVTQTRSINQPGFYWGDTADSPFSDKYSVHMTSSITATDSDYLEGNDPNFLNYFSGSHTVAIVSKTFDVSNATPALSIGDVNTNFDQQYYGRLFNARPAFYSRQGTIDSISTAAQDIQNRVYWAIFRVNNDTVTSSVNIILDDDSEFTSNLTKKFADANTYRIGTAASGKASPNSIDYYHDIVVFDTLLTGSDLTAVKQLLDESK